MFYSLWLELPPNTGEESVLLFVLVFPVVGGSESTEIEITFLSEYTRNGVFVLWLYKDSLIPTVPEFCFHGILRSF